MRSTMGICVAVLVGCHSTIPTTTVTIAPQPITATQHQTPAPNERAPRASQGWKVQNSFGAKKLSKESQELFRYSPAGVEVALFADMSQLKTGALWSTYGSLFEDALNQEQTFTEFVKESNWNPLEQTTQAYLAFTDLHLADPHVVVVFRAKNSKNLLDALSKDPATKTSKYKGSSLYSSEDISIVFPAADLVIAGNTAEVKEALDGTSASKDMLALLQSADSSTGMFGAVTLSEAQRTEISAEVPMLANLAGLYFSLNTSKGLDFVAGAKFPTKDEANSMKLFATLALSSQEDQWRDAGLWPYFEPLKIETAQTDLLVSWKLSEKNTLSLIESYLGPQKSGTTSFSKPQHKSNLGGKKTK